MMLDHSIFRGTIWVVIGMGLISFLGSAVCRAGVSVPPLFGDHMVLQRGRAVPIWGDAGSGEKITIKCADHVASSTADAGGHWIATLPAMPPGPISSLTIQGSQSEHPLVLHDVLVGDVWIASGQSNMQFLVKQGKDASEEIAAANFPQIRFFRVDHVTSTQPTRKIGGKWVVISPETAGEMSAVGYFFARDIHRLEKVPVGVVDNSWSGMPAESFTSEEMLKSDPAFAPLLKRRTDAGGNGGDPQLAARQERAEKLYERQHAEWEAKYIRQDPGNSGASRGWAGVEAPEPAEWKSIKLPQHWEDAGLKIDGAVWFRREVQIPRAWEGKPLELALGNLDDTDTTYFNGREIGKTGGPWAVFVSRRYEVPQALVKAGRAVIAVRVFDRGGAGGFAAGPGEMTLSLKDRTDQKQSDASILLDGQWMYRIEVSYPQPSRIEPEPVAPTRADAPDLASNIYNGMVNPLVPVAMKGVIWYQGESNADRARQYRKLFPAMIHDWRNQWKERDPSHASGDFPFLFVQLANYGNGHSRPTEPADSTWAELREAQSMTLQTEPNTAQAVIIDIGDSHDIHPKDKQDVGHRLALAAEKLAYGKDVEFSGPMYRSMKIQGGAIRVSFDHAQGLRTEGHSAPEGFQIAGEDQKWHWADAIIDGSDVIVSSPRVEHPVAVRYGWADDPQVNLYNAGGLPMSPFRTDDWKMVTAARE
jgi:sialate O-acetylesterase